MNEDQNVETTERFEKDLEGEQIYVFRYDLSIPPGITTVHAHKDWKPVRVGLQAGRSAFSVWGTTNGTDERVDRYFNVVPTGMPVEPLIGYTAKYIDSVIMGDGFTIFHVFEYVRD